MSEMRPFSESMDLIHTVTSCSSDTTSDTFSTKPLVSSEMCTSPSFFAPKSTKHPYSGRVSVFVNVRVKNERRAVCEREVFG